MSAAQLKTETLVQAGFRYCQQALLFAALRRRGDADAGALLVKVSRLDGTAAVFARSLSLDGDLAWRRATGEGWIPEEEAEARLAREIDFDPDVWIVEGRGPRRPQPLRDPHRLTRPAPRPATQASHSGTPRDSPGTRQPTEACHVASRAAQRPGARDCAARRAERARYLDR